AVLQNRRAAAGRCGGGLLEPRGGGRGGPAAEPVVRHPARVGGALSAVGARGYRPGLDAGLDGRGASESAAARPVRHHRRDGGPTGSTISGLWDPLALYASACVHTGVATDSRRLEGTF